MHHVDLEDLIDEDNLARGLPPAQRNPPCPPASSDMPVATKPKRPRRPRAPRTVQTDLEDFIAAEKAAEAAKAATDALAASAMDMSAARKTAALGEDEQPGCTKTEDAQPVEIESEAHSLSLGIKAVDFQNEDTGQAGDHEDEQGGEPEQPVQPKLDKPPSVLRTVQALFDPGPEVKKKPPICYCNKPRLGNVDVHLREDANGRKKAGVSGVWRCGNGEVCPMCVEAAASRRMDGYGRAGGAAIEKGGRIVTIVLSVSHSRKDKLADLMQVVKKASTGARAGGTWHRQIKPAMGCAGVLVDHHVRHGERYGWHYHQHLTMYCLDRDEASIKAACAAMVERYVRLLHQQGHRADAERQHIKILHDVTKTQPYHYPANHNAVDEEEGMELAAADHGEEESATPMMLAERAAQGDTQAAALFTEFAAAIRNTRSAVITSAMTAKLGIAPKEDEAPAHNEQNRLGSIPSKVWTKLIDESLTSTFFSRVEAAGRQGWRAVRWWALEETGFAPPILDEKAHEIIYLLVAADRFDDPAYREMARDMIGWNREAWESKHGAEIVADTMEYAEAHWRLTTVDEGRMQALMDNVAIWADKRIMRRWRGLSHMTLPVGDSPPPAASVPHRSVRDHVGQKSPISQQA
ncbi:MAG: hypothetical protein IR164_02995 [Devosia sp.]|uniref:hypothetical protein n=1 Tax=Devosia sp. TaxID=1871048 RepID=UPI001A005373|nr:hypothetical protein [Devosia sp.]MBF0677893.1 hypothetical protein [Devosia sp.]